MKPYKLVNGRVVPARAIELIALDIAAVVTDGKDTGVVVLLKGASRSMLATPGVSTIQKQRGDGKKLPKNLHVFLRDPVKRLMSAYQFFRAHPPITGRTARGVMTYEDFIDEVLGGAKNPHWMPATETLSILERSDVVPHLFENLADEYPLGDLERKNASKPVGKAVDLTYRKDELKDFYAGDYRLREEAA